MKFSNMVATATLALAASVNAEVTSANDCQDDYYKVALDIHITPEEKCEALVVFSKCLSQFPAEDAKESLLYEKNSKTCESYWKNGEPPSVRASRDNLVMTVDNAKDIEFYRHRRESISVFKMNEKITDLLEVVDDLKDQLDDQKKINEDSAAATAKDLQDKLDAKSVELDKKSTELETKLTNGLDTAKQASLAIETKLTKTLDTAKQALDAQVEDLDEKVGVLDGKVDKSVTDAAASIEKFKKDAAATNVVLKKSLTDAVDEKLKPISGSEKAIAALKTTRYNNPKVPVYRTFVFSTYSNHYGWLDGNSAQNYGGINPSSWTDGSYRADQMTNDFKYLARLFTKTATASTFGGHVCSDVYNMHSSTNGKVCGALFRIKNTAKSSVRWAPRMTMTSYTGWGESASITLNGNNQIGNRNCGTECRNLQTNLDIPANSAGNRISTVIFISTSTDPNHHYNYFRTNLLFFNDNALELPNNLEYVDDLDVMKGSWKK